jgi:hypothetical protein
MIKDRSLPAGDKSVVIAMCAVPIYCEIIPFIDYRKDFPRAWFSAGPSSALYTGMKLQIILAG